MRGSEERKNNERIRGTKNKGRIKRNERTMRGSEERKNKGRIKGTKEQ